MLTNLRRLPTRATPVSAASVSIVPDISPAASGTRQFSATTFAELCDRLCGMDAGNRLHEATGYPVRSCYYYASGERVPPVHFILKLFSDEFYGPLFFDALMKDNDANWWRERAEARDMGEDILSKMKNRASGRIEAKCRQEPSGAQSVMRSA
jgi:hypothetical protein